MVFVLLAIICGMGCKLRKAKLRLNDTKKKADSTIFDDIGTPVSSFDELASSPESCLQLKPMSSEGQSPAFPDPQALQFENKAFGHQNIGFAKESQGKEIGDTEC